jgi:hypothetical protein
MVTQNDTEWFTRRKRAWDEHRAICTRQNVTPLKWECFKRFVMRLDTTQEMVDCGVFNARRLEREEIRDFNATFVPIRSHG